MSTEPNWLQPLLRDRWGAVVERADAFDGEYDLTRRCTLASGDVVAVKVRSAEGDARPRTDRELDAAELASVSLPVAAARPAQDGSRVIEHEGHLVWVTDWLRGERWVDVPRPDDDLCRGLGRVAAQMVGALESLDLGDAPSHHWDLRQIPTAIETHRAEAVGDQLELVERTMTSFQRSAAPLLATATVSPLHQDLNDHNVLVERRAGRLQVSGVVDFGDLLLGPVINELAVAVAYAMLRREYPLDAAAAVVEGWVEERGPLTEQEVGAVIPLASGRLLVNALTWAARSRAQPDYARARSQHTWETLRRLATVPSAVAMLRISPVHRRPLVLSHAMPAIDVSELPVVDLDPHADAFDGIDPTDAAAVAAIALGSSYVTRHDTVRLDRAAPADGEGGPATIQLGIEVGLGAEQAVTAPLDGTVVTADPLVVKHELDGRPCTTQWSGLTGSPTPGTLIVVGDLLGTAGAEPLRVQLLDLDIAPGEEIPGHVRPAERAAWTQVSVDPSALLGLRPAPTVRRDPGAVMAKRNERLASSQRYYYRKPANLVRSHGCEFVDANAHTYLDAINNVTHVGHANPRVVEAATRQMRRLNTNSRFVYEQMGNYAERLAATLPDPLEVVFLVCTGSEANDLALRIARQVTGNEQILVIDGAYHGNTTAVTGISPDRYKGPGGDGPPPTTTEVPRPDRFRGPYGYDHPDPGTAYAADASAIVDQLIAAGTPPAAFIAESLMGTSGQIVHPDGYLRQVFESIRAAGGLCISDEVQVGFGRLGETFWGFELGGVVPDIVTMGKPMGNGHPIAAVVTTRTIADAFDQGMKYFNTFGGNPVSCAIAAAVLDEIEQQNLQARSSQVGGYFKAKLEALAAEDARIVDVRGVGLYLGIEFADDPVTAEPADWLAREVSERMLQRGIVVYPNGVLGNCLKLKPPMVFGRADVDRFMAALRETLIEIR